MITPNDTEVSQALDVIKQFCFGHQLGVAVAESVSAGYLQSILSSESEAGLFFEGGMTTYNCRQKQRFLDIPFEICDPCNGVDGEISRRMAHKICELFDCSIGMSLTGYASPIPEQGIFDLYAFGAIVLNGKVVYSEKILSEKDSADGIRKDYAEILITACAKILDLPQHTNKV